MLSVYVFSMAEIKVGIRLGNRCERSSVYQCIRNILNISIKIGVSPGGVPGERAYLALHPARFGG